MGTKKQEVFKFKRRSIQIWNKKYFPKAFIFDYANNSKWYDFPKNSNEHFFMA